MKGRRIECEKNRRSWCSNFKVAIGDDEMTIETYIYMEEEEITELELNTDELVDVDLGINYAQVFDQ